MNNHLTIQKRKDIIVQITNDLQKLINCFKINSSNFSILAIKVLERIKGYPELTPANRYQISMDILFQIVKDLDIENNDKVYLSSTIPSLIFNLSDISLRGIKNKTKNKKNKKLKHKLIKKNRELIEDGVLKVEEYVETIYNQVTKMILMQKIAPENISSQLIILILEAILLIDTFGELRGLEKKQLVIRAFEKLSMNLTEIFPEITPEEQILIKLSLNTIPSLIDSVISVIQVKFDVNLDEILTTKFWKKLCNCY